MKKALAACLLLLSVAAAAADASPAGRVRQLHETPAQVAVTATPSLDGWAPAQVLSGFPAFEAAWPHAPTTTVSYLTLGGAVGYYVITRAGWREVLLAGVLVGVGLALFERSFDSQTVLADMLDSVRPGPLTL